MKLFRYLAPAAVLAMGFLMTTTDVQANKDMAKKEKDLNDTGKCYNEKKDLAACKK
jgi:hypothetical protein